MLSQKGSVALTQSLYGYWGPMSSMVINWQIRKWVQAQYGSRSLPILRQCLRTTDPRDPAIGDSKKLLTINPE